MQTSTIQGATLISSVVLFVGLAFCPAASAQSQSQSQACTTGQTSANSSSGGNGQQTPQSVSQAAKNVKDSFKNVGSVFGKKKDQPAAKTASSAPCPPATAAAGAP